MNELAHQIMDLYERCAISWDAARNRQPLLERSWLDRFRGLLVAGGSVLDLGCGGGDPIAIYLAMHGFDVTGVDSSKTLLSLFRRRLPTAEALLADMRTLRLERLFQGVIAWDSCFHLTHDDQRRMFAVFERHSAPGAALMFTTGPAHGEAIGELDGEPLYHASLSGTEYSGLLSSSGYRLVAHAIDDSTCSGHTVWLAQKQV